MSGRVTWWLAVSPLKGRTVRQAVIETFVSSQSPDFTPVICRNQPQMLPCAPSPGGREIVWTYMKKLYPDLSSPSNGRRLWRNEI